MLAKEKFLENQNLKLQQKKEHLVKIKILIWNMKNFKIYLKTLSINKKEKNFHNLDLILCLQDHVIKMENMLKDI